MRAVVARVVAASVAVDGEQIARIGAGLLVLVGVTHTDTSQTAAALAGKLVGLRILRGDERDERDEQTVLGAKGQVLVVSQFTLYGDAGSGRRPSWKAAAPAIAAEPLVDAVVAELCARGIDVQTGRFGATMQVSSTNDGPFTLVLDLP